MGLRMQQTRTGNGRCIFACRRFDDAPLKCRFQIYFAMPVQRHSPRILSLHELIGNR